MAQNAEHFAIVVGVERYTHLPPASGAVVDATKFADWLTREDGGGLPTQNVQLIVSPPDQPASPGEARPSHWEIDRALRYCGVESGSHIGTRLYFYFAGHAVSSTLEDVALLLADAALPQLGDSISLQAYRSLCQNSDAFDEVVYFLDCVRARVDGAATRQPSLAIKTTGRARPVRELVLMSPVTGETLPAIGASAAGALRGQLTDAILKGLAGAAADTLAQQEVTSSSLVTYVQRHVHDPGGESQPEASLPAEQIVLVEKAANTVAGRLVVEVPHWTAQLRVLDSLLQPVTGIGPIIQSTVDSAIYQSETELPPGVYQVEASLEGKAQRHLVIVRSDRETRIAHKRWKIGLTSAAPLAGSASLTVSKAPSDRSATWRQQQRAHAVKWSTQQTWTPPRSGSSNLFLFVRTPNPEKYRSLATSLFVLDGHGHELVNISEAAQIDVEEGWVAFNADLEPGYYILRRGKPGKAVRYQPIYLCRNWQTQIFIEARSRPSLRRLTVNMARHRTGFQPDDDSTIAADAVLDSFSRTDSARNLITSPFITLLIEGKIKNPWFGILVAYSLIRAREEMPEEDLAGPNAKEIDRLLKKVMKFLGQQIADHPDVRALQLTDEQTSPAPFWQPPLLRLGLERVQRHATRVERTVPLNSLTDRVLDNLLVNSPWTAWRELDGEIQYAEDAPLRSTGRQRQSPAAVEGESSFARIPGSSLFLATTPDAPVFRLYDEAESSASVLSMDDPSAANDPESGTVTPEQPIADDPTTALQVNQAIQVQQKLAASDDHETTVVVAGDVVPTQEELIQQLIQRDNQYAVKIAAASGLPIDRINAGLGNLLQQARSQSVRPTPQPDSLATAQQAVLEYGLPQVTITSQAQGRESAPSSDAVPSTGLAEDAVLGSLPATPSVPNIAECVGKLRAEVDRLLLRSGDTPFSAEDDTSTRELAHRLQTVANTLLDHDEFVVLTDQRGRLKTGNAAFVALVSSGSTVMGQSTDEAMLEQQSKRELQTNLQAWEQSLRGLSPGRNTLNDPLTGSNDRVWELQQVQIEDKNRQATPLYLNTFWLSGVDRMSSQLLEQIKNHLPQLTLYVSLLVYGSPEQRSEYSNQLELLVGQLEAMLHDDRIAGSL